MKRKAEYDLLEAPFKGDIFGPEKLEQFSIYLADHLEINNETKIDRGLLKRANDNDKVLIDIYNRLTVGLEQGKSIPFAGQWLIDNFFVIEEQVRQIKKDLPKIKYDELPRIKGGEFDGYPRIYSIAHSLITHLDSHIEIETIKNFTRSFQSIAPLKIAELWAMPGILRMALMENLRRLMVQVIHVEQVKEEADRMADLILSKEALTEKMGRELRQLFNKSHLSDFVAIAQLSKRLRDQGSTIVPVYDFMTQYLLDKNLSIEEVVNSDHLFQAITQVSVANIVTSMRFLSTCDWQEFFESMSLMDKVLILDPIGTYKEMDFTTRAHYRQVIERLSKRCQLDEIDIARLVIKLARKKRAARINDSVWSIEEHVGHYLIGEGRHLLEKALSYKLDFKERINRALISSPNLFYLGGIALILCLLLIFLGFQYKTMVPNHGLFGVLILLSFFPMSEVAVNLINLVLGLILSPTTLPKLGLLKGVPDHARTFVVVPCIIDSEEGILKIIDSIEIHYLSNLGPNLYFALLSDYADSDKEEDISDRAFLELLDQKIHELNERYANKSGPLFFLFHRPRKWNESEGKWICGERKRGRLLEFNLFLRQKSDPFIKTKYFFNVDECFYTQIKYVITLGRDTKLPRESVRKLIGAALHPANGVVCILRPRIGADITSSSRFFARHFYYQTLDGPDSTDSFDVYQDLYGEGISKGKGLYVVDAVLRCLENKFFENNVYDQCLMESIFARTAQVSDVEFLDSYPSDYQSIAKSSHRKIRVYWQNISYLLGEKRKDLSLLSKWKMLNNLRESLVAPFFFFWLVAGWFLVDIYAARITFLALFLMFFPTLMSSLKMLFVRPKSCPVKSHLLNVIHTTALYLLQFAITVMLLPHQCFLHLEAIIQTMFRSLIFHSKWPEWSTVLESEIVEQKHKSYLRSLVFPVESIVGLSLVFLSMKSPTGALIVAAPFLTLWILSPQIIRLLSKGISKDEYVPKKAEISTLRIVARKTWLFFETFVTKEENWLPPDNFQEDPRELIAHRTSPTNMGVLLLSTAAAHDFGYLGTIELLDRLEKTLGTMNKLERRNGHFYNWYDTKTLAPLHPMYISTVDSGNLAAHLMTMKNACLLFLDRPIIESQLVEGLNDTLLLMKMELEKINVRYLSAAILPKSKEKNELESLLLDIIAFNLKNTPSTFREWKDLYQMLSDRIRRFSDVLDTLILIHGEKIFNELPEWTSAASKMIYSFENQMGILDPFPYYVLDRLISSIRQNCSNVTPAMEDIFKELKSFQNKTPPVIRDFPEKIQILQASLERLKICSLSLSENSELQALFLESSQSMELNFNFTLSLCQRLHEFADQCNELAISCDFSFLYDPVRKIFPIGYNVNEGKTDNSYYDLLASEARVASFFAIAKGDVPLSHWHHLSRQMTEGHGRRALISWSATMFEYLMPLLIMRNFADTLIYETYESTVYRQIKYGAELGLPWGISESAYNARDLHQNYQYGPFGVPGMGLKYGLSTDQVISPYSSALAMMIDLQSAIDNLRFLIQDGLFGKFGFYESVDYTKERLPKGQVRSVIKSYMVHHQGMIFISLDNVLHKNIMQERFHSDPLVKSCELLLQERVPEYSNLVVSREKKHSTQNIKEDVFSAARTFSSPLSLYPQTHILSNGQYSLMASTTGAGFSKCNAINIHRWSEDPTLETSGSFIYIYDQLLDQVWSNTYAPMMKRPELYQCNFSESKIEFWRNDTQIICHTEVIVSPEDNIELKMLTLNNSSSEGRNINLTSYFEPVLAAGADDLAHPAFSKLFIETKFINEKNAFLIHRRKRSEHSKEHWGIHMIISNAPFGQPIEYESDRFRFIGRGRDVKEPVAIMENMSLSNSDGTTIDPIVSLRGEVRLDPGKTVKVCFVTGVADTREEALWLIDQYYDINRFVREQELSWTKGQAQLRHINLNYQEAHLFQELAGALIYSTPALRPVSELMIKNRLAQNGLWTHGVSGDHPILLLEVAGERDLPLVRLLLRAHDYLRSKKMTIDFVIISNEMTTYRSTFHDDLIRQTHATGTFDLLNKSGGVFLLSKAKLPIHDKLLFLAFARVVIDSNRGSLKEQLQRLKRKATAPIEIPQKSRAFSGHSTFIRPELEFFNGLGGFNSSGDEYVIVLGRDQFTPAPWINVVANSSNFGFLISESGSGHTWSENSRENRLTPWSNDPLIDPGGEIYYLRDEETNEVWSPTPWPIRSPETTIVRHGMGYSQFEFSAFGLGHELLIFAALNDHVKVARLKIKNKERRSRKISLTYFVEWVLGNNRSQSGHSIITDRIDGFSALSARNPFGPDFKERIAICAISEELSSFTCDRTEFLGRNGNYQAPLGMSVLELNNSRGAGLDPCATMRTFFEIPPSNEIEIVLLLGQVDHQSKIAPLLSTYLNKEKVAEEFLEVKKFWKKTTETIQIKTPERELNFLCNHWALYQTLSCRIWARSALYQSGGAYGFRDQLQDVMGLLYSRPDLAREHILKTAGHQFPEGDVQHWWHPPTNKGVRTRFSDDLLWLPYVVHHYIKRTGDVGILDEQVGLLEGPILEAGVEELYQEPSESSIVSSLYDHCLRAIDHSLNRGTHGLPLMGAGDWNDGMNNVGLKGTGESVWVGWFLSKILKDFSIYCLRNNDLERKEKYISHSDELIKSIEEKAWDGKWYIRAFFDDGTPLGSTTNDECKIDSLTQSWSVLSGLGHFERQLGAMEEVGEQLVLKQEKICLLFRPPFNHTRLNPGYIKGYPPGIRENGGQYTHAAIWAAMAFCRLNNSERAHEILFNINPITRTSNFRSIQLYRVEPYVICADIYFGDNYSGRGGWSWYTGSSSLYYQAILEYVLGMNKEGDMLSFSPCIPRDWNKFEIVYTYESSTYLIEVKNPHKLSGGTLEVYVDNELLNGEKIKLINDAQKHVVLLIIKKEL